MPISQRLRMRVLEHAGFRCVYCGCDPHAAKDNPLQVDHIVARANGGTDDIDNLVAACRRCNLGKSSHRIRPHDIGGARFVARAAEAWRLCFGASEHVPERALSDAIDVLGWQHVERLVFECFAYTRGFGSEEWADAHPGLAPFSADLRPVEFFALLVNSASGRGHLVGLASHG